MSSTTKTPYGPEVTTGTTTSFVALTTTFSAPSACKSAFVWEDRLVGYDPGYGVSVDTNLACGPGLFTTWWMQGHLGNGDTRVSIGPMTCPEDWTTVASSIRSESSTLEMCCPSGYHLTSGISGMVKGDCVSDVTSGMTLTYRSSDSSRDSYATRTTTLSRHSTVGAIALVGWNIDYPTPSSTSMSSSMTTSSTSSASTATQTSENSNSNSDSGNSGSSLSSGAKAGIGIGVGVGAIGVIALLVALWMFRRRKGKPEASPGANQPVSQNLEGPSNMYPPSAYPPQPPSGNNGWSNQGWYQPAGAAVPPSHSDHIPSSNSQASGAVAAGALQSSSESQMHSETIISSMSPSSSHQRGGSIPHNPPQLAPVEAPDNSKWISELQGSTHYGSESQTTQQVSSESHSAVQESSHVNQESNQTRDTGGRD